MRENDERRELEGLKNKMEVDCIQDTIIEI